MKFLRRYKYSLSLERNLLLIASWNPRCLASVPVLLFFPLFPITLAKIWSNSPCAFLCILQWNNATRLTRHICLWQMRVLSLHCSSLHLWCKMLCDWKLKTKKTLLSTTYLYKRLTRIAHARSEAKSSQKNSYPHPDGMLVHCQHNWTYFLYVALTGAKEGLFSWEKQTNRNCYSPLCSSRTT